MSITPETYRMHGVTLSVENTPHTSAWVSHIQRGGGLWWNITQKDWQMNNYDYWGGLQPLLLSYVTAWRSHSTHALVQLNLWVIILRSPFEVTAMCAKGRGMESQGMWLSQPTWSRKPYYIYKQLRASISDHPSSCWSTLKVGCILINC